MFFVVKTSLLVFTMAVVRPYQLEPTYSNEDREQSSSSEDESSTSTARINDDTVSWCTCGKCVTMERERENICCKEITQVVAKLSGTELYYGNRKLRKCLLKHSCARNSFSCNGGLWLCTSPGSDN